MSRILTPRGALQERQFPRVVANTVLSGRMSQRIVARPRRRCRTATVAKKQHGAAYRRNEPRKSLTADDTDGAAWACSPRFRRSVSSLPGNLFPTANREQGANRRRGSVVGHPADAIVNPQDMRAAVVWTGNALADARIDRRRHFR